MLIDLNNLYIRHWNSTRFWRATDIFEWVHKTKLVQQNSCVKKIHLYVVISTFDSFCWCIGKYYFYWYMWVWDSCPWLFVFQWFELVEWIWVCFKHYICVDGRESNDKIIISSKHNSRLQRSCDDNTMFDERRKTACLLCISLTASVDVPAWWKHPIIPLEWQWTKHG